jgi:hypothetical protein
MKTAAKTKRKFQKYRDPNWKASFHLMIEIHRAFRALDLAR